MNLTIDFPEIFATLKAIQIDGVTGDFCLYFSYKLPALGFWNVTGVCLEFGEFWKLQRPFGLRVQKQQFEVKKLFGVDHF